MNSLNIFSISPSKDPVVPSEASSSAKSPAPTPQKTGSPRFDDSPPLPSGPDRTPAAEAFAKYHRKGTLPEGWRQPGNFLFSLH